MPHAKAPRRKVPDLVGFVPAFAPSRLGLSFFLLLCGFAFDFATVRAQDAPPAARQRVYVEARAIDQTATLFGSHGGQKHQPEPVPLPDSVIKVVLRMPDPAANKSYEIRTDEKGAFAIDLGELPERAEVHFLALAGEAGSKGQMPLYARPLRVGAGKFPEDIAFYQILQDPSPIVMTVMRVVTSQALSRPDELEVRVRQQLVVQNYSFGVWIGRHHGDEEGSDAALVSFYLPVPQGFEVRAAAGVATDGRYHPQALGHGGLGLPITEGIFPTLEPDAAQAGYMAVFARPYREGDLLDLGMHVEFNVAEFTVALEEPGFFYLEPDAGDRIVALRASPELNRPMGTSEKSTRPYSAQEIPAHANVSASIGVGKPPVHRKTWIMVGLVLSVITGSISLGLTLAKRRRRAPAAGAAMSPAGPRSALGKPDLLHSLRAIADRPSGEGDGGKQQAEDIRVLARALAVLIEDRARGGGKAG